LRSHNNCWIQFPWRSRPVNERHEQVPPPPSPAVTQPSGAAVGTAVLAQASEIRDDLLRQVLNVKRAVFDLEIEAWSDRRLMAEQIL
jgi:hypothetical protein